MRHSLLKYSSAAGKRFYSSGGQRNTLAQVLMYNSVRRSLSVKYNSAAGNRFYSSGGQRNTYTLAHVLMYDSVRRSLLKYSSAAGKRFYSSRDSSGGQRNTLAQVSMCDSVRRSLFKYNSTVVKRFYPSGGQRNTLAQPMKLNETAAGGITEQDREAKHEFNKRHLISFVYQCIYVCTCIWCVSMRLIHTFASYFAFQNNQNALTSSIFYHRIRV